MKKILITQSNYIPWIGYFDAISQVDEMVVLDCVQYTRRDWRNRNKILTPKGEQWLTLPVSVKGKYSQSIAETMISDPDWNKKHWLRIKQNYAKAPYFSRYSGEIEKFYQAATSKYLSEINILFLKRLCDLLGISTVIKDFRDFQIVDGSSERLLSICKQAGATSYYSGPAAKEYLNLQLFKENGVEVYFFKFDGYPLYKQIYEPNMIHVSILDMLFNIGDGAKDYLGSGATQKVT